VEAGKSEKIIIQGLVHGYGFDKENAPFILKQIKLTGIFSLFRKMICLTSFLDV